MSKISAAFARQKAFIAYLMAGDPDLATSGRLILAAQEAGADLIEIGIPFSDPIAEGEVIQAADIRALDEGTHLDGIFQMVADIQDRVRIPLLFMTYLNPVFIYGYERFFAHCQDLGISGIILPDLPFEEQSEVREVAERFAVDVVTMIAPTSGSRIRAIASRATGFIYLVSSMGVTGMRSSITTDLAGLVAEIKKYTQIPVAIGFGVSTPAQAAEFARIADGVIVGSAIVNIIAEQGKDSEPALRDYVRSIKAAISG